MHRPKPEAKSDDWNFTVKGANPTTAAVPPENA